MKQIMIIITFLSFVTSAAFGQSSVTPNEMNLVLSVDDSLLYGKESTFDYFTFTYTPALSLEFGSFGNIGLATSGVLIKSILSDDSDMFLTTSNAIEVFGRVRLTKSAVSTLYGFLNARLPLGVNIDTEYDAIDYVCNVNRRWYFRIGGHIESLDDPSILAIQPYFGYDISKAWDVNDGYFVLGNSIVFVFAVTDRLAAKINFDLKYNIPFVSAYADTLSNNGLSSYFTFSFVQKIGDLLTEGGIRRSLAIIGETLFTGSTSYIIPIRDTK